MLQEIPSTRQRDGEARRRWFTDRYMDLTVWQDEDGGLLGFQLAYDKGGDEHALDWHRDRGLHHYRVDDGESDPGRYKQAPLLMPDGAVPWARLVEQFRRRGGALERDLRDRIMALLERLPE